MARRHPGQARARPGARRARTAAGGISGDRAGAAGHARRSGGAHRRAPRAAASGGAALERRRDHRHPEQLGRELDPGRRARRDSGGNVGDRECQRPAMRALTPANQLTLLRMLLIPAFVILVVYGQLGWALFVFCTAGVTDALDGLIARRTGQKTSLGAWLDPMADKLLLVTTFVVLTLPDLGLANRLPIWLTVLIISRDVGIVLTVAIVNLAVGPRTFRPSIYGKIATATYIVTAVAAIVFNYRGYHSIVVD